MTLDISPTFTWNESVWNPSMLGPALWLDAADASTITESGGAGAPGSGRDGGTGKYSAITGTSVGYAGGGAANSTTGLGNASEGGGGLYSGVIIPAAANRGGGGRGDSTATGSGGSGIVIVRYAIA